MTDIRGSASLFGHDFSSRLKAAVNGKAFRWRAQQLAWILRREGIGGASDRLRRKLAAAIAPATAHRMVRDADILSADLARHVVPEFDRPKQGEAIRLNWIMSGADPGSGGHTTIFRIIGYLEQNGYRNHVYFSDARLAAMDRYVSALRSYYRFDGPVSRFDGVMEDAHGVFATSWPTAYAAFASISKGKRFYFVQDHEPDFYAASADRILAENTYRMGFHAITAGRWLAEKIKHDYGMQADPFEFGCDTTHYHNRNQPRSGIAFYARPGTPRRGYELGILALQLFASRCPDIDIHLYGETIDKLPFKAKSHGLTTPQQLNDLYNQCFAGLSLSLTNVSLVPLEMLAAGCIPVLNDATHNRMVIDDPHVHYAAPTPHALCAALEAIVDMPNFSAYSQAASASQQGIRWESAGETVDGAIRAALDAGQESGGW